MGRPQGQNARSRSRRAERADEVAPPIFRLDGTNRRLERDAVENPVGHDGLP
jgi:hypothetical protein